MTESQSSSDMLTSTRSRRMPALLTRTWRSPKVSTAVSISRLPPSQSATSSALATASPPAAVISSTTCWAGDAVVAGPVDGAAQVVDHHLGPFGGEQQGVLATDAATGPGDDGDPSVQCSHVVTPLSARSRGGAVTTAMLDLRTGRRPR